MERARLLLSSEPRLGRHPPDLVRESDEQARTVVQPMSAGTPPAAPGAPQTPRVHQAPATEGPFVALALGREDEVITRDYRTPSLAGRSRPIGGLQEQADPFTGRYTIRASHAIPLRTPATGA